MNYNMEHINIYFALTKKQQQKFHSMGLDWQFMQQVTRSQFISITKNKKLIARFKAYKYGGGLKLVA